MYRNLLAVAAATVIATAGTTYAVAADHDSDLGTTTTRKADDTVSVPKGYSCNVGVKLHYVGTETTAISLDGQTRTLSSPDETVEVTNVKTGKKIKRTIDGSFVVSSQSKKHRGSLEVYGFGRNLLNGKGIKGIVFIDGGVQRISVTGADTESDEKDTLTSVRGGDGKKELCKEIGAKPVEGRNAPSDPSSAQRMTSQLGLEVS